MFLLLHNLKCKQLLYLFIGCILFLPLVSLRFYVLFASLALLYELLDDEKQIWIPFLVYPLGLQKIVIAKMISSTVFSFLLFLICGIGINLTLKLFMFSFTCIYLLIFLFQNFVVADGYLYATQVNVLKVLGTNLLGCTVFYQDQWMLYYQRMAPCMIIILFIGYLILLGVTPKTMYKKVSHQIALDSFLKGMKMMQEITMLIIFQNRKPLDELFFTHCSHPLLAKSISILLPSMKENMLYIVFFLLSILLQVPILCILSFVMLLYHMCVSWRTCTILLNRVWHKFPPH